MRAVILAGGKGTRLLPYTKFFPKPLVPIGEKPILDTILRQLKYFSFTHVTLAVGHMSDMIRAYIQTGEKYGMEIGYEIEAEPLGTVGPLAQINGLNDDFLVMNGDIITNLNYGDLVKYHRNSGAVATIASYEKQFKIELGIIHGDNNNIEDYIEKPVQTFNVSMGIYIFSPTVLQYIEPEKYLDFPSLIRNLLDDGQKIKSYPFTGYWLDIGNHTDFEKATEEYDTIKGELHLG